MALPIAQQNGVFTHVYPIDDLGFTPVSNVNSNIVLGVSASEASNASFSTGCPATVLALVKLSAGGGTLNLQKLAAGATPTFTGGDNVAVTLSGTDYIVGVLDTDYVYDDSDTKVTTITTDKRFVAVELEAGGSGMTVTKFAILVLYELTTGEDWFVGLRSSAAAVTNRTTGDGHGKVSLDPALANSYNDPDILI